MFEWRWYFRANILLNFNLNRYLNKNLKFWTDINLVWNPKDFNNIKSFVIPADKVWVPDLHLFNRSDF